MLKPILLCATIILTAMGLCSAVIATEGMPSVYFINLKNGDTVQNPVLIQFGLRHMGIAPAGIEKPNTGHHHLLINTPLPLDLSQPLPANEHIRHFGAGQTEVLLTLPSGKHRLQLLLGDHVHRPHANAVFSEVITITVP